MLRRLRLRLLLFLAYDCFKCWSNIYLDHMCVTLHLRLLRRCFSLLFYLATIRQHRFIHEHPTSVVRSFTSLLLNDVPNVLNKLLMPSFTFLSALLAILDAPLFGLLTLPEELVCTFEVNLLQHGHFWLEDHLKFIVCLIFKMGLELLFVTKALITDV